MILAQVISYYSLIDIEPDHNFFVFILFQLKEEGDSILMIESKSQERSYQNNRISKLLHCQEIYLYCQYVLLYHNQQCLFSLLNGNLLHFRYYDLVRDVRQNKGSILKASVEYIRKLKNDQHKKRLLEEKVKIQESQNRKLLLKLQVNQCILIIDFLIFISYASVFLSN